MTHPPPPGESDISPALQVNNLVIDSHPVDVDDDKKESTLDRVESSTNEKALESLEGPIDINDLPVIEITPEEDKKVLRKLDKVLIPLTMVAYTLQYIDRSAMSYAALFTFRQDLNLSPADYSWLGSVFHIGYLVFEFPGSYILQRYPLSKTMSFSILSWAALLLSFAGPRSFIPAAVLRALLGASEALITPGFVLLVSRFYKRSEQPLRVGVWYCCNGLGSFIGAFISYGMGHVRVHNLPSWTWIFIFNGALTVVCGICFLIFCPENPQTAKFLTHRERLVALERVRGNKSSLGGTKYKWDQVAEALLPWRDPQGWIYVLLVLCLTIPNGGISNFLHLILQSYGYDAFQTILMGQPQSVMQVIFPLSGAYIARRYKNARIYVMMGYVLPSIVGVAIQWGTRVDGALLFGYYIMGSYVASLGICFAAPGANIAGYTKKTTVGAMVFIAYATGNIIGPHLFKSYEDPPYRSGMLACLVCFAALLPIAGGLRLYYIRENKRRDRLQAERGEVANEGDFEDLTDVQNLSFRYAL